MADLEKNYSLDKFEKLPNWAKIEIRRLEANNEVNMRKLAETTGENPTSNTYYELKTFERNYLPKDQEVSFKTSKGEISVRVEKDIVKVMSNSSGKHMILVPTASNTFNISYMEYVNELGI